MKPLSGLLNLFPLGDLQFIIAIFIFCVFLIFSENFMQRLTGGILLSRNKDFLVFYRGKDFLSSDVTEVLLERERLVKDLQDEEELARTRASGAFIPSAETKEYRGAAGTLSETLDANTKWGKKIDDHETEKVLRQAEVMRHANLVRKLEGKLAFVCSFSSL